MLLSIYVFNAFLHTLFFSFQDSPFYKLFVLFNFEGYYIAMAGISLEGSQYDANQYDAKMNDVYVMFYHFNIFFAFLTHDI